MDWQPRAEALAKQVAHPTSRWYGAIAATPRHVLVPNWWRRLPERGWTLRNGQQDPGRWAAYAYSNETLVTRVGGLHADEAAPEYHPRGRPTSSATLPGLLVTMLQAAVIPDRADVLCVTGSGYTTALLSQYLGDEHVTSVDVDPYLVHVAQERLELLGHKPRMEVGSITGPLPGAFDRIVSTVSVPGIPSSWLTALRPGGRLVTTLSGTGLLITADVQDDGGATGFVTQDRASFMDTRTGTDYEPGPDDAHVWEQEGDDVGPGLYPVVDVGETYDLRSMLGLKLPGLEYGYREDGDVRTAVLMHPDGSWARAVGPRDETPIVHQSGPLRLWDTVDLFRGMWLTDGRLPAHGATVRIEPGGTMRLSRGSWLSTVSPAQPAISRRL